MSAGGLVLLAVAAVAVYLVVRGQRRQSQVFVVRARPPLAHTLQSLIVLATVVACVWFAYWMMTQCRGGAC